MGYLEDSYRNLNPTKTDMYQLTMSQGYFDQGRQDEEASFYMHWRNAPFESGYTVAAGLEGVTDFLNNFKFSPERIQYLKTLEKKGQRLFTDDFLDYLANTPLKLKVDAIPEGTVMTGQGPVIRISGPLAQAQLVESAILNIVNSASIVATRAARLDEVSKGRPFIDFSLRRAGTLDSSVARSSYIGGAAAVADVDAAATLGIPPSGTMAHAWIMGFKAAIEGYKEAKATGNEARWVSPFYQSRYRDEYETMVREAVDAVYPHVTNNEIEVVAFKAYLKSMPMNSILLVDTFDPIQGVKNAIRAAKEMNTELDGVRLDSGDIYALSWEADALIKKAKQENPKLFSHTRIYATDGLEEKKIQELQTRALTEKGEELPIGAYGVGTELGNPGPLRGGVYKVSANEIIREDFETTLGENGATSVIVGSETIPIKREQMGTMKVAGINPVDPSLPGPKSSMPGYGLNTLRLKDADGKQIADVIVDETLRPDGDWHAMLNDGVVDTGGKPIDLATVASTETLLKPIFALNKDGVSEYVYDQHGAPGKRPAYKGGPEVTDLDEIKAYARSQRAQLSEAIRSIEPQASQPILMDPLVCKGRQAIMAEMATVPGGHTTGDLSAENGIKREKE